MPDEVKEYTSVLMSDFIQLVLRLVVVVLSTLLVLGVLGQ